MRASPPRFSIKQAIAEDEGDKGVVAGARATAAWLSLMVLRRTLGASCAPAGASCVSRDVAAHFTLDDVRRGVAKKPSFKY